MSWLCGTLFGGQVGGTKGPDLCPHLGRDVVEAIGPVQGVTELGAKYPGERFHGEERVLVGG